MKNVKENHKIVGIDPLREDRIVGILRPKKQPEISEVDGLLQFKNEQLFNPDLRKFECFLTGLLNDYAEESFKDRALVVSAGLYLDPQKLKGFPLFSAWSLEGTDVDSATVRHFREMIARITGYLTEQPSLFHQREQLPLAQDTDQWLTERIQNFRRRNAGKNYAAGFSVHLGIEDISGMLVSGKLPLVENPETVRETFEGIGYVDGFKHTTWEIYLVGESNSGKSCEFTFKTSHRKNLEIASLAFNEGKFVCFKGYRIQKPTDLTPSYQLKNLEMMETQVDAERGFELT